MIVVAGHTRKRWLDRSDAPNLEPSIAWREALRIPAEEFDAPEARYHPRADVVLLRRGASIATALEADVAEPAADLAVDDQREGSA